ITNEIATRHLDLGRRINVVMLAHGWVDQWAGLQNGTLRLSGNTAEVQAIGYNARDRISMMYFESCCTGKGKTLGRTPNLLFSLADGLTSVGQPWTTVCGWSQSAYSWTRWNRGRVGHTRRDVLACSPDL